MEPESGISTFFDSPERAPNDVVLQEILHLKQNALMNQLIEGYPELAVLLNDHRQIVAFNSRALQAFGTKDYFDIIGKRVGEAIKCIHSSTAEGGCGTSLFCRQCGAANVIKTTVDKHEKSTQECRITASDNDAEISFDFLVHTQPISFENKCYTFFTIQNISHEKRREALEKTFFHDVLNTAGALKGLAELLAEENSEIDHNQIQRAIYTSANQLVHEITSQRELRYAEDGLLKPIKEKISALEILENIKALYQNHALNMQNNLSINFQREDEVFVSDTAMLIRSIGNLVKNALEASNEDQKVILDYQATEDNIAFHIKSEPVIPEDIQHQLFKRSFSTKQSKGRGIGLYSVKLITEQFLKGKVSFQSDKETGTVFTITLPIQHLS